MFYTTISLIKYLCMCLLNKYYRNCGGHRDSDRIVVLVMVSKAESIVLYLSSCIMYSFIECCVHYCGLQIFHVSASFQLLSLFVRL